MRKFRRLLAHIPSYLKHWEFLLVNSYTKVKQLQYVWLKKVNGKNTLSLPDTPENPLLLKKQIKRWSLSSLPILREMITLLPISTITRSLFLCSVEVWKFRYGEEIFILEPGDCVYFDATIKHSARALNDKTAHALVVESS